MFRINSYLLLSLLTLLLLFPGITNLPVLDRDEAHFAQASRQMVQTGQYFQIRFQDKTRFQKPPGINWLQAASVKLFSDGQAFSIWPYRIPSLLGALFSVLLTYFFARQFVGEQVARLAAGFLASTLLLAIETHMAVIDTSLLSAAVLMQGALWIIYQKAMDNKPAQWGWAFVFWLAMAYGFVLKGVTPLVGVLTVLALCVLERRVSWLRWLRIPQGLLLFVLLSLAWLLHVNAAEHSNYLLQMVQKDLLPKLYGGHESHGKPPLFHLFLLPLMFWPASLFLWQGGVYAWCKRNQRVARFLLAWIVPTWLFFEIMPTKLPQYVLPTFPAIALFCALAVVEATNGVSPSKFLRCLQMLWGVLSLMLALSLSALPYLIMQEITMVSVLSFVGISVMSSLCVYLAFKGSYRHASYAVLMTALLAWPLIFSSLLPPLKPLWVSRNIVQLINKKYLSDENPLLVVGYREPSLVFYLNTKQVQYTPTEAIATILREKPTSLVLVNQRYYESLVLQNPTLEIIARNHGYDYNNGRWINLLLLKEKNHDTI